MSSSLGNHSNGLVEAFGLAWNRFWFMPADPLPCCVLRIAVGLLAILHFASLGIELERWYSRNGLLPPSAVATLVTATGDEARYRYSYLDLLSSSPELWIVHGAALVAAGLFAAGLFTRVSGLLTLIAVLAYVHRVPQVAGHLEPVLVFLLAYLTLAPSGACLSLDSLVRRRRMQRGATSLPDGRQPSTLANVALRLIQIHVAMFYAMMGLTKLYGDAWWDGNAIWVLLAQTESRPLDLSGLQQAGQAGEYLINFWTHAVVYFELSFPVLIWNRYARPVFIALSVVVWISLMVVTGLLLFGIAMIVAGTAFLPASFFRRLAGSQVHFGRSDLMHPTRPAG